MCLCVCVGGGMCVYLTANDIAGLFEVSQKHILDIILTTSKVKLRNISSIRLKVYKEDT